MRLVIFGLTVSSTWGNGHATLWRGLCRGLARMGHHVTFFERDVPYYAANRDLFELPGGELFLYRAWDEALGAARSRIADADAAIVTSYCPDAVAAGELVAEELRGKSIFYDLDTPVTLSRLTRGETVDYIGPFGLAPFDLVLSYTGGRALDELRTRLKARHVVPLYGHVDPDVHHPVEPLERYSSDLSYLGTYASDRQAALERLLVEPARLRQDRRFLIGGAQYPHDFPWSPNIYFVRHLPPSEHPAFFSSSRLTLNITRRDMADMGWCPSGRLFEASACGAAMLSDAWEGLDQFFGAGEILIVSGPTDVAAALDMDDGELKRLAAAGRARTLCQHTSAHRTRELVAAIEDSADQQRPALLEATEA